MPAAASYHQSDSVIFWAVVFDDTTPVSGTPVWLEIAAIVDAGSNASVGNIRLIT